MRNIEVKARLLDPAALELRLQKLAARFVASFRQRDVFFTTPQGRLKLRFAKDQAELIYYVRSDDAEVRGSDYQRQSVTDGEGLCLILQKALGSYGEVCKQRRLYLLDNIRIHIGTQRSHLPTSYAKFIEGVGDRTCRLRSSCLRRPVADTIGSALVRSLTAGPDQSPWCDPSTSRSRRSGRYLPS